MKTDDLFMNTKYYECLGTEHALPSKKPAQPTRQCPPQRRHEARNLPNRHLQPLAPLILKHGDLTINQTPNILLYLGPPPLPSVSYHPQMKTKTPYTRLTDWLLQYQTASRTNPTIAITPSLQTSTTKTRKKNRSGYPQTISRIESLNSSDISNGC
jgi:hypothetical protein